MLRVLVSKHLVEDEKAGFKPGTLSTEMRNCQPQQDSKDRLLATRKVVEVVQTGAVVCQEAVVVGKLHCCEPTAVECREPLGHQLFHPRPSFVSESLEHDLK